MACVALLLCIVGSVVVGSSIRPEGAGVELTPVQSAPAGAFGIGRERVLTAPGATIRGTLLLPDGVPDTDASWLVRSHSGDVVARGAGRTYAVDMPRAGALDFEARLAGEEAVARTTLEVRDVADLVARDLRAQGTVLVDGALAVDGEALAADTELDTEQGRATYLARATSSGRVGRLTLSGASVRLRAEAHGGRVTNHLEMDAVERGTRTLVADVEHLDGTRYVQVDTPTAVAMVKGTRLVVTVAPRRTTVTVDHGWVVVRPVDAAEARDGTAGEPVADAPSFDVRDDEQVTIGPSRDAAGAAASTRTTPVDESVVANLVDTPIVQPNRRSDVPVSDVRAPRERDDAAPRGTSPAQPQPTATSPGTSTRAPQNSTAVPTPTATGTAGATPPPAITGSAASSATGAVPGTVSGGAGSTTAPTTTNPNSTTGVGAGTGSASNTDPKPPPAGTTQPANGPNSITVVPAPSPGSSATQSPSGRGNAASNAGVVTSPGAGSVANGSGGANAITSGVMI